ncbi:hypothetical protein N8Z14_04775 [Gammaproteobacteria bacterium]|nr:hypothetical protein [Gammaproteobacteria bacterium]
MYRLELVHDLNNETLKSLYLSKKLFDEIKRVKFSDYLRMPTVKKEVHEIFSSHGFRMKQKVHVDSNIFISGIQNEVGLCIQMGYKNNWYYDMAKLSLLKSDNHIKEALIVLPSKELEKLCHTSNVATFELIIERYKIFKDTYKIKPHILKLDIKKEF